MNYIIISKSEKFTEGAELIKKEAVLLGKSCKIIEIDDLSRLQSVKTNCLFYFLTNDQAIPSLIKMLREKHSVTNIINGHVLSKKYSKLFLQNLIQKNKIEIPNNAEYAGVEKSYPLQFPLYLKSQRQADQVKRIHDISVFKEIDLDSANYKNFYLEEAIEKDNLVLRKIY